MGFRVNKRDQEVVLENREASSRDSQIERGPGQSPRQGICPLAVGVTVRRPGGTGGM